MSSNISTKLSIFAILITKNLCLNCDFEFYLYQGFTDSIINPIRRYFDGKESRSSNNSDPYLLLLISFFKFFNFFNLLS